MKNLVFIILSIVLFSGSIYSQNAITYFTDQLNNQWFYEIDLLDSLNNPIPNSTRYRRDIYVGDEMFQGRDAKIVHVYDFLSDPIASGPITDTLRYSFEGTNAFQYIDLVGALDSIPLIGKLGLVNFLNSLKNWYSIYRFASNVNSEYTLFSRDTTISVDTLTLPLRFSLKARRLSDQTLNVPSGTFTAKRFVQATTISFLIIINPFPPIEVPIVRQLDTTYHVQNRWILKQTRPSVNVDLNQLGFPLSFFIPGTLMKETLVGSINQVSNEIPDGYYLGQNYPNPFNPVTNINFGVTKSGNAKLTVYDMLGRETATLVNEVLSAGSYSYTFEASTLNSGTYFYKLEAGGVTLTKKMLLIK